MFKIPDLDTRINHTKYLINNFDKLTDKIIKDKKIKGGILYFFHSCLVISVFLILLFGSINIYFYISLLIWIIIMILHIYFGGCIFIRIERELLDNKSWKGLWTHIFDFLEYMGYEITNDFSNNIFICVAIIICFVIFIKMVYYL